jgi:protein SCO1/2
MMAHPKTSSAPAGRVSSLLAAAALLLAAFGCAGAPEPEGESEPAATSEAPFTTTQPEILIPAPDFAGLEFRNQNDELVTFDELRGKPTLLAFIYTRCPMPMMCPATMLRFQEVQKALSAEERAAVQLVTMTFDPAYDTPAVLAEYGALWDVDTSFWALLTGSEENVQAVASAYGVWYEQTEDGNFDHTMYSMILFADGAVHELLQGTMWNAETVAGKLLSMAAESAVAPH